MTTRRIVPGIPVARAGGDMPARSAKQDYFQRIESTFVRLRGAPLLLSPKDWQIVAGWYDAGIPLEIVRQALREVFEKRAEGARSDRVSSLAYCRRAVEKAWRESQELQLHDDPPRAADGLHSAPPEEGLPQVGGLSPPDIAERVDRLASKLTDAVPDAVTWRARIRACAEAQTPGSVEQGLADVEASLLRECTALLASPDREHIESEVDAATQQLRMQVSAADWERARESVRRQAVRQHFQIPRLSLYRAVY